MMLIRWLRQPLLDVSEINSRQDSVEILYKNPAFRNRLRDGPLKGLPDLDAVLSKVTKKKAGLGELYRLYLFSQSIPTFCSILSELVAFCEHDEECRMSSRTVLTRFLTPLKQIGQKFSTFEKLVEHVLDFDQLPELKVSPKHDPRLKELSQEQGQLEADAEAILRQARDSWASSDDVKMERNSSTSANSTLQQFLLRSTKADERQLKARNPSVQIVSILKTGIYFTTPALRAIGERFSSLQEEYREMQQELVEKAMETAVTYTPLIECVAHLLAELDVLTAFSTAAALSPGVYVRPKMLPRGEGIIQLEDARHPCVELMDCMSFIPNDYHLQRGVSNFQIVTGPNMGGKSTFIRAIAAIVVLGQVGMFVPCKAATLTVVDCILARVGAGDAVQKGISTFMAEMLESSTILMSATADSLIVIDELGRGTSTFDGFGLAWAISDFISSQIRCFCLFATHFHELTALAKSETAGTEGRQGVVNKHVAAVIEGDEVVMLHSVKDGPCLQSFGIHIANTAGFPKTVIQEAKRKAAELENSSFSNEEKYKRVKDDVQAFRSFNIASLSAEEVLRTPVLRKFN